MTCPHRGPAYTRGQSEKKQNPTRGLHVRNPSSDADIIPLFVRRRGTRGASDGGSALRPGRSEEMTGGKKNCCAE
jgi:hypothetical protein